MRELIILRQTGPKTYEEVDYFNYLTGKKERLERFKKVRERYPKDRILAYTLVFGVETREEAEERCAT